MTAGLTHRSQIFWRLQLLTRKNQLFIKFTHLISTYSICELLPHDPSILVRSS